jgi:hypothetical protein
MSILKNKKSIIIYMILFIILGIGLMVNNNRKKKLSPESSIPQTDNSQIAPPSDSFSQKVYAMIDTTDMVLEGDIKTVEPDKQSLTVIRANEHEESIIHFDSNKTLLFKQPSTFEEKVQSTPFSELVKGMHILVYAQKSPEPQIEAVGISVRIAPQPTHLIEFKPKDLP